MVGRAVQLVEIGPVVGVVVIIVQVNGPAALFGNLVFVIESLDREIGVNGVSRKELRPEWHELRP
jgi:hypothetical protein